MARAPRRLNVTAVLPRFFTFFDEAGRPRQRLDDPAVPRTSPTPPALSNPHPHPLTSASSCPLPTSGLSGGQTPAPDPYLAGLRANGLLLRHRFVHRRPRAYGQGRAAGAMVGGQCQ
eukprot:4256775-Prymnesium_polylepis.2